MGIQDNAIQQILANSAEMAPLQKEQLQQSLDASKTAYTQAQSDREYLLNRRDLLSGMQDSLVSEAKDFNTEARREELAGQAMADVNSAASNARAQSARSMARMGVTPGSGKSMALNEQTNLAQTATAAGAANNARTQARQEGRALTDRAVNALAGYPAMSTQSATTGAALGTAGVGLTNSALAGQNSGYGSAAAVAGQLGTNASSMYGAQANYSANMNSAGSSFGDIAGGVGSLVGTGMKLWSAFSDIRLKEGIRLVGVDRQSGVRLYSFRYRGGRRRFVGAMVHEVKCTHPAAVTFNADGYGRIDYRVLGFPMIEVRDEQNQ